MGQHIPKEEYEKVAVFNKAYERAQLKKRLIGWSLVVGTGIICFAVSFFTRIGLSTVFDEDSWIVSLGAIFTLFSTGYFFHQHFKNFWDSHLS